ncbi:hypothetical protein D3C76_1614680 [compost metagenome]
MGRPISVIPIPIKDCTGLLIMVLTKIYPPPTTPIKGVMGYKGTRYCPSAAGNLRRSKNTPSTPIVKKIHNTKISKSVNVSKVPEKI